VAEEPNIDALIRPSSAYAHPKETTSMSFPENRPGDCAVAKPCVEWFVRPRSPSTTWSFRSSCVPARVCTARSRRCRTIPLLRRPACPSRGCRQPWHSGGDAVWSARAKGCRGKRGWHPEGIVQRAIRAIKKAVPDLAVAADCCFCEYTTHGHCGVILEKKGDQSMVDNDATLENLGRVAMAQAQAGADIVAPRG